MARKRLINFKTVFGAAVVVLLVVVTAILIIMNSNPVYNDDYFKSDGLKLVTPIEAAYYEGDEETPAPVAAYMVYYYSGETIIDVKTFYKFESAEIAKNVYNDAVEKEIDWVKDKKLSREYLIFSLADSEYKDLSTSLIRSIMEE